MTSNSSDLLEYFWPRPYPQSHPPNQVAFSNGIPESEHDITNVAFVMPYHTFKTAVNHYLESERQTLLAAIEAKLPEQEKIAKRFDYPEQRHPQVQFQRGYNQALTEVINIIKELQ